jgi:beta-fructofuranosidase
METSTPAPITTERVRPALHFTPRSGWINDPHGVVHIGGRYHMFVQHNPHSMTWSPACHWLHATSPDLVRWREEGIALAPESGEIGCWSGSVVLDGTTPTIIYTRIVGEDWGSGQVALARGTGALDQWLRDPAESVIDGPPGELRGTAFRDPYVWRSGPRWTMLMGIGLPGGTGAAVQYSSSDLLDWVYEGVVAERNTSETDGTWTGKLWECPQLLQVDGTWVLLVSVWDDDVLNYVAYAIGDYDGRRFQPRTWGRFTHGDDLYATTAFRDVEGRPCVMSWFRERSAQAPQGSPYAGAISLPYTLAIDGETLIARPHPDLAAIWTHHVERRSDDLAREQVNCPLAAGPAQVQLGYHGSEGSSIVLTRVGADATPSLRLVLAPMAGTLTLECPPGSLLLQSAIDSTRCDGALTLVIDADLLELTATGVSGMATARIPVATDATLSVTAHGTAAATVRVSQCSPP